MCVVQPSQLILFVFTLFIFPIKDAVVAEDRSVVITIHTMTIVIVMIAW